MRKKWNQPIFVYILLLSLVITLGMNVHANPIPIIEDSQLAPATAVLSAAEIIPASTEPPALETIPAGLTLPEGFEHMKPLAVAQTIVKEPVEVPQVPLEEAAAEKQAVYEVTAYYLNVRTQPSADSNIIKVIEKGSTYEVAAETDNGWLKLKEGGFVNGRYLKKTESEVHILSSAPVQKAPEPWLLQDIIEQEKPNQAGEQKEQESPSEPSSNVSSDSGLSEEHIAIMLEGTELADEGLEQAILEIEEEYGINAYFTIAVMKLESGNGKSKLAKNKNNLFGLNAIDGDKYNKAFSFDTKADSVRKFGQLLSKNYVGKGLKTIEKVAKKYCPANSKWSGLVKKIMKSDYRKL